MAAKSKPPDVDPNRHVKEYLKHYFNLPYPPRYAVMINGAWGIGKTYLVQNFLKEHFKDESEYVYISLYGLSSIEEVDTALFRAIYPALNSKFTKLMGRGLKAFAKYVKFDPDLKLADVLDKFRASVFVFDDLERCELPINTSLGYINEFVEHDTCKVLVIANDTKIKDRMKYQDGRAKLIGKALEVQSAFDEALAHFSSHIKDSETKKLFEKLSNEISAIYDQSGLNNLRFLQQTMWDFERLYQVLTNKHRKNRGAMNNLIRMFFALSFELRAGRLKNDDLISRGDKISLGWLKNRDGEGSTPIAEAGARYPEVRLDDPILSDVLLSEILVKGIVDGDEIAKYLGQSPYFVKKGNEPDWRVVWYGLERGDEEFDTAYKKMEKQFENRDFTIVGEILHVFGIRLWLADIGVSERSRNEVISEGKQYINDLYAQGRLETSSPGLLDDFRLYSYGGLGMYERESDEFQELAEYLNQKQQTAKEDQYPAQSIDLLGEMVSDSDLFFRRLNSTNSDDNLYYNVPILASTDPDDFVSNFLKLHPAKQRIVMDAFKTRYEHGRLNRDLSAEKPWLENVREKLQAAAKDMSPIGRYRIEKNIEWNISTFLPKDEEIVSNGE